MRTRIAHGAEVILEDPICDPQTLRSCDPVGRSVMDPDINACVDDLLFCLGKTCEGTRLLERIWIGRGHLEIQNIRSKKEA